MWRYYWDYFITSTISPSFGTTNRCIRVSATHTPTKYYHTALPLHSHLILLQLYIVPIQAFSYCAHLRTWTLMVDPPTSSPLMWISVLLQRYRYHLDVNSRFTYYLNHLAPLCAALRRSRVAQCHQGVVGGVPKPSYSLLLWVQRFLVKVNTIH